MQPFKVLASERLLNEKYCTIDKERVEFPDGSQGDWFIKQNDNAVIVLPILKTGEVLIERTYKHGCGEVLYEFPAGLIDPGESPELAAERELLEETGYRAETLTYLGEAFSGPTGSPMKHIYFLGEGCKFVSEPEREPAEQIEVELLPDLNAAKTFLKTAISSNTAYTALTMYDLHKNL